MLEENNIADLTIVGGGTTGLFAAYYATMRGMSVKLIESQSQFGGKVLQFFPEKLIYDVGGFPDISGEALVQQMIKQASRHQPEMLTNTWIETIEKNDNLFTLYTASGDKHLSKTVLLATGSGTFHIKKAEEWDTLAHATYRSKVSTNLMNREKYDNKHVVIASNNKVGVGWALDLKDRAESVTIVNPLDQFHQLKEDDLQELLNSNVEVYLQAKLHDLKVEDEKLLAVEIATEKEKTVTLRAEEMLTYHGLELQATPLQEWGVETTKGQIVVAGNMASNIPGIFAAGDIVQYEGKTNLIASGYTEAITAVNKAHKLIDPKATEQLYSTVIYR